MFNKHLPFSTRIGRQLSYRVALKLRCECVNYLAFVCRLLANCAVKKCAQKIMSVTRKIYNLLPLLIQHLTVNETKPQ